MESEKEKEREKLALLGWTHAGLTKMSGEQLADIERRLKELLSDRIEKHHAMVARILFYQSEIKRYDDLLGDAA